MEYCKYYNIPRVLFLVKCRVNVSHVDFKDLNVNPSTSLAELYFIMLEILSAASSYNWVDIFNFIKKIHKKI